MLPRIAGLNGNGWTMGQVNRTAPKHAIVTNNRIKHPRTIARRLEKKQIRNAHPKRKDPTVLAF